MENKVKETEDATLAAAKKMLLGMLAPLDAAEKQALLVLLLKATE